MRTKALLCAAALAAGALTSMAQVYSANVVGYVNVTLTGNNRYTMICNPLDATMGGTVANANSITHLFANVASDGDFIYRWNVAALDFDGTQPQYSTDLNDWTTTFDLNPGEGVWYISSSASDKTVTFVGQVLQGTPAFTYAGGVGGVAGKLVGNNRYNAIGSPIPLGGSFKNAMVGVSPNDGDFVYTWDTAAGDWSGVQPQYSTDLNDWTVDVTVDPGIGLIYINSGADQSWTRDFTVQ